MSFVRGQVVENQRSVQRTARRDHTTPFSFVLADFQREREANGRDAQTATAGGAADEDTTGDSRATSTKDQ